MAKSKEVIRTTVLDDSIELSLSELSQALNISGEFVLSLVDEGIIEPEGGEASTWRFRSVCGACALRCSTIPRSWCKFIWRCFSLGFARRNSSAKISIKPI